MQWWHQKKEQKRNRVPETLTSLWAFTILSMVCGPAAFPSPKISLEIQDLCSRLELLNGNLHFEKISR